MEARSRAQGVTRVKPQSASKVRFCLGLPSGFRVSLGFSSVRIRAQSVTDYGTRLEAGAGLADVADRAPR